MIKTIKPEHPIDGEMYYDMMNGSLKLYMGGTWVLVHQSSHSKRRYTRLVSIKKLLQ